MKRRTLFSSGGVLIVVLVVILVGAVVMSGWVTIMTAEMSYADQFSTAVQRRIALGNATSLARQYLLANVLTKSALTSATADAGGGWGSVIIPAPGVIPPTGAALTSTQKAAGYNYFNPGNGDGYTQDIPIAMGTGTGASAITTNRLLQIKSRSSLLSGTLTVLNQPGHAVTGTFSCNGQTVNGVTLPGQTLLWVPVGTYSIANSFYLAPSQPNTVTAPENFPFVPLSGSEVAGAAAYDGSLNVIAVNTSGSNSLTSMAFANAPDGVQTITGSLAYNANGVVCNGSGSVTITLLDPNLGNVIITGVTNLTLVGQVAGSANYTAADTAAASLILINQTAAPTVTCQNANNRKLVIAIKTTNGSTTTFNFSSGAVTWRSLITLENTPAVFSLTGGIALQGGIQTNSTITVTGGGGSGLSLSPETTPKLMERLADRDGWVEAYTTTTP